MRDHEEERAYRASCPEVPPLSTPEGRLLSVVRCILADAEPPANLQKPFNAVLGETARHEIVLAGGVAGRSVPTFHTHTNTHDTTQTCI